MKRPRVAIVICDTMTDNIADVLPRTSSSAASCETSAALGPLAAFACTNVETVGSRN